jgi:hypothetical protein
MGRKSSASTPEKVARPADLGARGCDRAPPGLHPLLSELVTSAARRERPSRRAGAQPAAHPSIFGVEPDLTGDRVGGHAPSDVDRDGVLYEVPVETVGLERPLDLSPLDSASAVEDIVAPGRRCGFRQKRTQLPALQELAGNGLAVQILALTVAWSLS